MTDGHESVKPPESAAAAGRRGYSLQHAAVWTYSFREYAARLLWRLVWLTAWQLCWHRVHFLRAFVLRAFGADVPGPIGIRGSAWVECPWNLRVGPYCSIGPRVVLYNLGPLVIGPSTVISQDAYLCGGTHDHTDPAMPLVRSAITIGDDVWICAGAFVGPGVTVGPGAVVGARAVVTGDVEPWTVVAGNPARKVRDRVMKGDAGRGRR
jgi:putative colanic acid biosynthesis acetyltransferase WcaF